MSIKARLDKLEKTSGGSEVCKDPLVINIANEADFSPEEIALLKADDDRIMQEIKNGQYCSPLGLLLWDQGRLTTLKQI